MWRQDGQRELDEQAARTADPEPPAPVVAPGSLAWASAVGNSAVARYAQSLAPKSEEAVEEDRDAALEPSDDAAELEAEDRADETANDASHGASSDKKDPKSRERREKDKELKEDTKRDDAPAWA